MNACIVCLTALLVCALSASFALAEEALPAGTPVLGPDPLGAFRLSGKDAEVEIVPVQGQPFARAIRARTRVRPAREYGTQLTAPTVAPVEKGDVLHARFWLRALEAQDETAEGVTEFVFEKLGSPWTKSRTYRAKAGVNWKRFDVPFKMRESYAPAEAHVCMRLGFRVQVIEIGGFELVNFGKRVDITKLPVTIPSYRGQAPDARWRKEAEKRIDRHRKGDLRVRVTDRAGRPVPGAAVSVEMRRHAYAFGSCVNSHYLQDGKETEDKKRYRDEIRKLFNRTVIENNLKWWGWEKGREKAVRTVDWLLSCGIEVRGHCLVWPSWRHVPGDMKTRREDGDYLRKRCLDHITDEAGAMKGKLVDWDVINEPFTNHDLMDVLGPDVMVEWFKRTKETDPGVNVYINDYGILTGGGGNSAHRDHYERTIRFLIEKGAPLDGIGMQGHFGSNVTPPEDLWKILDRFARFAKPIQVTEFDMKTGIEPFEAAYTRDFMTAVFSHPATAGILMWGFWDGRHWKKNAPIYRKDWSLKPSGETWIDLVFGKWWTQEEGRTDRRGEFKTRGFLGEYRIAANHRGRTGEATFTLTRKGGVVTVALE